MLIRPDWPAPKNVQAISTTRQGGMSGNPYSSLNLAHHVEDKSELVEQNRASLPNHNNIIWLSQCHSEQVVEVNNQSRQQQSADASYTCHTNVACAVMTADCLPILLCDREGTIVAAIHAGWRGLAAGIIENTVHKMGCDGQNLYAWMGPAIGASNFEVGAEVKDAFSVDEQSAFASSLCNQDKYLADIYQIARTKMGKLGIQHIFGGEYCTFTQSDLFFSYRRDGETGRMASYIWLV